LACNLCTPFSRSNSARVSLTVKTTGKRFDTFACSTFSSQGNS
jgi:hypothetical protein